MPRPRKSSKDRRVGVAVYMEPALKRRLEEKAQQERRSASTQAVLYIEAGLAGD
jgi:hypothetical protein